DPRHTLRCAAASALGEMGATAQDFALPVSQLLDDKLLPVQVAALEALPRFGAAGGRFAAEVCRLTMRGEDKLRVAAMQALTQMGERGAAFAEEMEAILDDPIPAPWLAWTSA
ncbi:MCAT, partial [Symbiodinium sp. KB8]